MTTPDILVLVIAAAAGYAVGSLPVSAWVARAGGPGWGLLALTVDLSKGVLPVALATVTWSWAAGWAAGLGVLGGACWPALGRIPRGRWGTVFAGVAFALAPPAGIVAILLALLVAGVVRMLGRNWRFAAIGVGAGTYPLLFFAAYPDPARLALLMCLYLVALVRLVATRQG